MGAGIKIDWNGDAILKGCEEALSDAIIRCAEDLRQQSMEEVPKDQGDLQSNCSIAYENSVVVQAAVGDQVEPPGEAFTAKVGYTLPYARRQHEDLSLSHPNGGKAKYLEDPLSRNAQMYKQTIADAINGVIK